MKFIKRRLLLVGLIVGLAVPTLAQQTKVHEKLANVPSVKGVKESTLKLSPQIQPYRSSYTREHENPAEEAYREWFKLGEPNDLVLGGLLNESRVQFQPSSKKTGPFWPAISATGWVPADATLAVSKTHVVVTVNSTLAFFTKAGTKTFEQRLDGSSGFWGSLGAGSFVFDPKCFFDPHSGRFFVVGLELDEAAKISKYLIAVSSSDNPNGTWTKYRLDNSLTVGSNQYWLDYPGWGFNKDWIVASGNMYPLPGSSGFGGAQVFAFNKANLIAGNTNGMLKFRTDTFTIQWAKNTDPSSNTCYGVAVGTSSAMSIFALKGTGANTQLVSTDVTVPTWQRPAVAAESKGGHSLDSLDGRMLAAGFFGGHLVAAHTSTVSNSDTRDAARWYDFQTNNWPISTTLPTLFQGGQVAGTAGQHFFMPAIQINSFGDIAMTFTRSSSLITADMMVTGRKPTDPLGQMGVPQQMASSIGIYGGGGTNRWGDYFGVEVDPFDGRTFWGVAMTGQTDGSWLTNVNTWKISSGASNVAFDINSITPYQGTNPTGTVNDIKLKDSLYYSLTTELVKQLGEAAAATVVLTSAVDASALASFDITVDCTGVNTSTLQVFANDLSGKPVLLNSFAVNGATTGLVHVTNPAQFIGANKQLTLIIRGLKPTRIANGHTSFKIDRVTVLSTQK